MRIYRYADLKERRIVKSRMTLKRWVTLGLLPPPIDLGPNSIGFDAWISSTRWSLAGRVHCPSRKPPPSTSRPREWTMKLRSPRLRQQRTGFLGLISLAARSIRKLISRRPYCKPRFRRSRSRTIAVGEARHERARADMERAIRRGEGGRHTRRRSPSRRQAQAQRRTLVRSLSRRLRQTDGFIVTPSKHLFLCRPSGATGDAVDMVEHALWIDRADALAFVLRRDLPNAPLPPATIRRHVASRSLSRRTTLPPPPNRRSRSGAKASIRAEPSSSGISTAARSTLGDDLAGDVMRWHPRIGAMLALFRNIVTGEPQAISRTFLDREGRKIERKFLGPVGGAAIMLDPVDS